MKLSFKPVRASHGEVSWALWRLSIGTDVVPLFFSFFSKCVHNRLPEIMKNGDAGIFPVYYSLKYQYQNKEDSGNCSPVGAIWLLD